MLKKTSFKYIVIFLTLAIVIGGCASIQNPVEISYITHEIIEDVNNYPQKRPGIGKIYIGDKFQLFVRIKNDGPVPISKLQLTMRTSDPIVFLAGANHIKNGKEYWTLSVEEIAAGDTKTVSLPMRSQTTGSVSFEFELVSATAIRQNKYKYSFFINAPIGAVDTPFRPSDIPVVLQQRTYDQCKKLFPCQNKLASGSCSSYPDSVESRACVVRERQISSQGCEITAYDEASLNQRYDCLAKKHHFKFPPSPLPPADPD